jgi:hypothetical protein
VYQGHWTGQLVHFHNPRPHLRILANEAGTGITTTDSIHHSKSRTISLDNLTNGITRMPSKLPEVNGTSSKRITKILIYIDDVLIHTDTHEKHLEALEQVLMTLTPAPPEDQLGQMPLRQQTSLLSRIYPNSRRHQTRRGKA